MTPKNTITYKWIEAGLEHFTLTGKIEINKISKKLGLSKSSFYNVYAGDELKKPLENYFDDILTVIDDRLDTIMTTGEKIVFGKSVPDSYREGIEVIKNNYKVYRSLGILSTGFYNERANKIYEKYKARLIPMTKHLISQMYPEIPEPILMTTSVGLIYAGTLFMLQEPELEVFAKFANEQYDRLYFASSLGKKGK